MFMSAGDLLTVFIQLHLTPTYRKQQSGQWPYTFDAIGTSLVSLVSAPPQCSSVKSEKSPHQRWSVVVRGHTIFVLQRRGFTSALDQE